MRFATASLMALLVLTPASRSVATDNQLVAVALSGNVAPGTGVNFAGFSFPTLNDAGQAAFTGQLSGNGVSTSNNQGVWSDKGDTGLTLLARTGNTAPGTGGSNFVTLGTPILNDVGQAAFLGGITGLGVGGANNLGVWSEGAGTGLGMVAQRGNTAPDTNGADFSEISPPVFNDAGQMAFIGTLSGIGLDDTNNRGIWSEGGVTGLALLARTGSTAPDTEGAVFSGINAPVLNLSGQTAFLGGLTGAGVSSENSNGIWSGREDTGLALVVRSGHSAPGTGEGVSFSGFGAPAINSEGQTAFFGIINGMGVGGGNSNGIWSEGGNAGLALVARAGNEAPGTDVGVNFSGFGGPVLNAAGQTAFTGFLTGTGVSSSNSSGIWSVGQNTGLGLVARAGSEAPGTSTDVNFSGFGGPVFNDAGQTAFTGFLTGAEVDSSNDSGIWAEDLTGILKLIAREGDMLDVGGVQGTDLRTVSTLSFLGNTGSEDGRASGFNNLGQLVFQAEFTDGSSGVFISNSVAVNPLDSADFNEDSYIDGTDFLLWQRGETSNPLEAEELARWKATYGTAPPSPADFDSDKDVDGADFLKWQRGETSNPLDAGDLDLWKADYGQPGALTVLTSVPEPSTLLLLGALATCTMFVRRW